MNKFSDLNVFIKKGYFHNYRGFSIFYRDTGKENKLNKNKKTLVLLHGFPTSSVDWIHIWKQLDEGFRIISPDFLGFGFSDKPQYHKYKLIEQADIVEDLLKSLKIKKYHILAHDYGDSVAQELLFRYKNNKNNNYNGLIIQSCVLLNGGIFPDQHRPLLIQKLLINNYIGPLISRFVNFHLFKRNFLKVFGKNTKPLDEELRMYWSQISFKRGNRISGRLLNYINDRQKYKKKWVDVLLAQNKKKTIVPILLIIGPSDPISGKHVAKHYRELNPKANIRLLPTEISHYPQIEDPKNVLKYFMEFHKKLSKK